MSQFTIFKLKCSNPKTKKPDFKFCARFLDENGQIVKTKTLLARKLQDATIEAQKMLEKGGLGILGEDPLIMDIISSFWKEDSHYALAKTRKGEPLSKDYIYINGCIAKKHLAKKLEGLRVSKITVAFMERVVEKFEKEGKNPRTINGALNCLQIPLRKWSREHGIPYPLEYFDGHCKEHPKERGTLSIEEIQKIIDLQDESPRIKLACLLGSMCGLRLGEVVGLQPDDVDTGNKIIHVRHNWVSNKEGLKGPKCGSKREVPLPTAVEEAFNLCISVNPYNNCPFVLWNDIDPEHPADRGAIYYGFKRLLARIGIKEEQRKSRNLVFHGLRHTFVSLSRASGLPDFLVMRMAGHKSASMMENYSHAGNVIDFTATRAKMDEPFIKKESADKIVI
jgi:integrase